MISKIFIDSSVLIEPLQTGRLNFIQISLVLKK